MHQYRVKTIYEPGPDLYIVDWLSRQNHKETKDPEIPDMQVSIYAIQSTTNIPQCMTMHELQQAIFQDEHLQHLKECIRADQRAEIKYHRT